MSSPLLALATGALGGMVRNRADEDQRRKEEAAQKLETLRLKMSTPGFHIEPDAPAAPAAPTRAPAQQEAPGAVPGMTGMLDRASQIIQSLKAGAPDPATLTPADNSPENRDAQPLSAPTLPPAATMHRVGLDALSAPPKPAAPDSARHTEPINVPGFEGMHLSYEDPESKIEQAARLRDERAEKDRVFKEAREAKLVATRRAALEAKGVNGPMLEYASVDPEVAHTILNQPKSYSGLVQDLVNKNVPIDVATAHADKVFGRRDPVATHRAIRKIDLANPLPSRAASGESPQVQSTRKDLRDTQGQQIRAENATKALKSEQRAMVSDHPRANRPLSEQRTAADSSNARQYEATGEQIRSAAGRAAKLTQRADSILNVIPQQRAKTRGPNAGNDLSHLDDSITDEELKAALDEGATDEESVRQHVARKRGLL